MSPTVFAEQMALLSQGCVPQNLSEEAHEMQFKFYRRMLIDLTDAEFEYAVVSYIREEVEPGEKKWFPPVARLAALARPLPTDPELAPIFTGIEQLNRWDPQGYFISAREVEAQYGAVAREAFVTAGGSSVFQRLDVGNNRTFVMKTFFAAYREAAKSERRDTLIGPPDNSVKRLIDATVKARSLPDKKTVPQLKAAWNAGRGK